MGICNSENENKSNQNQKKHESQKSKPLKTNNNSTLLLTSTNQTSTKINALPSTIIKQAYFFDLFDSIYHSLFHIEKFKYILEKHFDGSEAKHLHFLLLKISENLESFHEEYTRQVIKELEKYEISLENDNFNIGNLIIQLIEILHIEQKKSSDLKESYNYNGNINKENKIYNKDEMLKEFLEGEIKKNYSEIMDLFCEVRQTEKVLIDDIKRRSMYFFSYSVVMELNIKPIFINYSTRVGSFKINKKNDKKLGNPKNNKSITISNEMDEDISLVGCLEELQNQHETTHEDKECNEKIFLFSTPQCLIFYLNRRFNKGYFSEKVLFEEEMDLTKFILCSSQKKRIYRIISVIKEKGNIKEKEGEEERKRKYVTYNKDYKTGKFYYYEGYNKVWVEGDIGKDGDMKNKYWDYFPVVLVYVYK